MFSRCLSTQTSLSAIVIETKFSPDVGSILRVSIIVRQISDAQQRAAVKDMVVIPLDSEGYSVIPGYRSPSFTLIGGLESKLLNSRLLADVVSLDASV